MAKLFPHPQKAEIQQFDVKAAETFTRGAVVLLDANEDVIEAGADPAAVLGFAEHDAEVDPDTTKVLVAKCDSEVARFWMAGDNNPLKSDINQDYGVVKTSGVWLVDGTDTTNLVVHVHDVDLDRNLYKVSVVAAARQSTP